MVQGVRVALVRAALAVCRAAIALVLIGLLSGSSQAGETWDGNGSNNNWTTDNNWNPNGEPPNDGTANIVMAGTNRLNPNVNVDWDVRSLVFSNTAGAFVINGSDGVSLGVGEGGIVNQDSQLQTVLLPINLNANQTWSASLGPLSIGNTIAGHPIIPRTLTVTGAFDTSFNRQVTGAISLTKNGSGTLVFGGGFNNTYSGTTTVNAGTLVLDRLSWPSVIPGDLVIGDGFGGAGSDVVRFNVPGQISAAAGNTITVNSTGLLDLNGHYTTIANLSINGGTVSGISPLSPTTVNGSISSGASSASGTISGGTLNFGGGTKTITVADGSATQDLVIISTLTNGAMVKDGAGTLVLSGSGSNSMGPVTINAGTVLLNKASGADAIPSDVTIGDGVGSDILRLSASHQIPDVTLIFPNSITVNSSGLLDLNGFDDVVGNVSMYGGSISTGVGTMQVNSFHAFASSQPASFSGILRQSSSGEIDLVVDDGTAVDDLIADASLPLGFDKRGSGQMRLTGSRAGSTAPVTVSEGTLVLAKTLADSAIGGDVTVIGSLVFGASEQISSNPGNEITLLGTLDLAGFNEAINDLTISTGTVMTGGGTLVMQDLELASGQLNPSSGAVTINGIVRGYASPATALLGGNVTLSAANRTFDVLELSVAAVDLEVTLALAGANSLTKTGAGTLLLSGAANTYSGVTTVSGGVLLLDKSAMDGAVPADLIAAGGTVRLAADEQIATAGTVTLNAGGLLDLNGFNETIGNLSLDGGMISMGAGTLVVTGGITQSTTAASSISGRLDLGGGTRTITSNDVPVPSIDLDISAEVVNGGIIKQGAGALRLGGDNTFSGGVSHQAGRLVIGHDNALGTGMLSLDGGTIEADGGPRNIANPVVVNALSTVSGSDDLTFSGSFTTSLGAALAKSGAGALTIAGPQTHAAGATLFATAGTVNFDSSASGATLSVNLNNAGTVVNFNAVQDLNTLVVNGGRVRVSDDTLLGASNLSIDTDAVLELEMGGLAAGDEFAQLVVGGNAALAGTLQITLTGGFTPSAGDSFDVLDWGSLSGTFATLLLPSLGDSLVWKTTNLYTSGLLSVALAGDYNGDGAVDAADYVVWRKIDGTQAGYDTWRAHFGDTVGGGAAAEAGSAAVPEPDAMALMLLAWLVVAAAPAHSSAACGSRKRSIDVAPRKCPHELRQIALNEQADAIIADSNATGVLRSPDLLDIRHVTPMSGSFHA